MEHNKLDAYNLALDFVGRSRKLTKEFPRGFADLSDQLWRASTSIALNLAEGAGEYTPKDKAKFYRYARRSSSECAAVLEIVERTEGLQLGEARAELEHLAAMITNLLRRCE